MIIQKTKLHNELREMRVSKCDGFSPFYMIFWQFTVNTAFVIHIMLVLSMSMMMLIVVATADE